MREVFNPLLREAVGSAIGVSATTHGWLAGSTLSCTFLSHSALGITSSILKKMWVSITPETSQCQSGFNWVKVEPDVAGEQITTDAGQHTQKNLQRQSNKIYTDQIRAISMVAYRINF